MGRRTALLIAAVVIAALGTTLVFLYVNGVNDRALANQSPVAVLVAKGDIATGTSIADAQSAGLVERKTFPKDAVVSNAVSNTSSLTGLVTTAPIYAGEQIITARFGAPGANTGLAIPTGKLAGSFQLSDPARVAGFVSPGSTVAIFVSLTRATGSTSPGGSFTQLLLPAVTVLAVGPTTTAPVTANATPAPGANPEAVPRAIMTLALTENEMNKLVFASGQGQLYMGLLPAKATIKAGSPIDYTNLFG